ncbi:MAG TPA: ABC transporter ATP-binding protein [bacterium]|nr:ABC transporter ATP-binding protein [bacterium]
MFIIEASDVKKTYTSGFLKRRRVEALKGITLSIEKGEIFGFLGPNGAGKSTFLNILMGLLLPDSGEISILGNRLRGSDYPMKLKKRMNMCSGNPNLPWCLTVRENLRFYAMLYDIASRTREKRISGIIEEMGLSKYADTRFDELSTGNKQKLSLAKSLINEPEILLLDEPTIGLDPDISQKIRVYIKKLHKEKGVTVILTTHYMKEAEGLCGRIAFINNGEIKAQGTTDELQQAASAANMEEMFIELANKQD